MGNHSNVVGGSTAGRLIECPASYKLSQGVERRSSSFADEGSMLHAAMEVILLEDKSREEMIGFEHEDYPGHILTDELYDEMVVPALDALDEVARLYGEYDFECEAQVKYPDIDGAFGTADIIGGNDRYAFVLDFKFGRGVMVSAQYSPQLAFYTNAAMNTPELADFFEGDKPIIQAIIQPAFEPAIDIFETDKNDIAEFHAALIEAWEEAQRDNPPAAVGDHCRFCPAMPTCPEQRKGVDLALPKVGQDIKVPELSDLMALCDQLEPWIKAVRKAAHETLEAGDPVPGWKLVPKRATRRWANESEAFKAMSAAKLTREDTLEEKVISPAKAEKLFKKKGLDFEKMSDLVIAVSSGNTLAPDSDPRPDAIASQREGVDLALPKQ